MKPARKRKLVDEVCSEWDVSIRRACKALEFDRTTYHHKSRCSGQAALEQRIRDAMFAFATVIAAFMSFFVAKDWRHGQNKTRRTYPELALQLRDKTPKRGVKAKLRDDRRPAISAYQRGVALDFSRPGKPTDNAFVEAFNGRFREECLNAHWFLSLADALEKWRIGAGATMKNGPMARSATNRRYCCKTTLAQPARHRDPRRKNLVLGGPKFGLTAK